MGFLDRMAADLLSGSTGMNKRSTRRLVRRAGGGKLLLMGAAAVVMEQLEKGGQDPGQPPPQPSGVGSPPPLPPVPGSAAGATPPPPPPAGEVRAAGPPPPPPPAAAPAEQEATLPPDLLYPVVRAMVGAALADGKLDSREKAAIEGHLGDSGLAPEQIGQIHRDLVFPPLVAEVAALVSSADAAELVYRFAAMVVKSDAEVVPAEEAWLRELAAALGIEEGRRWELETEVFGAETRE